MLCVKEEAIDKTFDEFNEMFLQKVRFKTIEHNFELYFHLISSALNVHILLKTVLSFNKNVKRTLKSSKKEVIERSERDH